MTVAAAKRKYVHTSDDSSLLAIVNFKTLIVHIKDFQLHKILILEIFIMI